MSVCRQDKLHLHFWSAFVLPVEHTGEHQFMLKSINLKSILQAKDSLKDVSFNGMLKYHGIELRNAEIEDIRGLVEVLGSVGCGLREFSNFFLGYKIPQIGKEFDLLRFGRDYILNVELKSSSTQEKIKKQLRRNKYYLSFLKKQIVAFTYVSATKELYILKDNDELERADIGYLGSLLAHQQCDGSENLDDLFDPSDYLVSPFNSSKQFLAGEYFLTQQQEDIKGQIVGAFTSAKSAQFISIQGSAGTGKTLLTYDIANYAIATGKKVLVIHCGQLNGGHLALINFGWKIIPAKDLGKYDLGMYDLITVDESQRIYPKQFEEIVEKVKNAKCYCIFSHDKLQTLSAWEKGNDVSAKIRSIPGVLQYKLSEKVRTNAELASFIKLLFNNKQSATMVKKDNVAISYFSANAEAKNFLNVIDKAKWEVLKFTPSQYNQEHHEEYSEGARSTSHQVIGQEFDGVVIIIDRFFSYNENGDLIYRGRAYYDPVKMLFQNITRARKRLSVVIINNEELLNRCVSVLQ
jgi:hypothetical protein